MTSRPAAIVAAVLVCLLLSLPGTASAQKFADSVKWRFYLSVLDSSNLTSRSIAFPGLHTRARYAMPYDTLTGFTDRWFENSAPADTERDWPPRPPGTDLRLQNPRLPLLSSSQYHMMHPFVDSTMIDTQRVDWVSDAINSGDPLGQVIRWPAPAVLKYYADSIKLRYQNTAGVWLNVELTRDSQYVLHTNKDTVQDGSTIPTNNLRLIIYHPKRPLLPPDSVTGIYPPNGSPGQPQTDSVKWQAEFSIPGYTNYYRVQIANDRTFKAGSILLTDSVSATSHAYTLSPGAWYYWRVKAFTPYGVGIYKTKPDSFFVGVPVPKINLISPTLGQTNVTTPPALLWHRFPYGTVQYRVQLSASSSFSTLLGDSTLSDTSCVFPIALADCDTFYWRVRGSNEGGTGPDTVSWFRSHFAVPAAPVQLRVPDGSVGVPPNNLRLSWVGKDQCTDFWRVQIATDTAFVSLFVNSTFTDTFAIVNNLLGLKTYYWRVRSENAAQQSAYSSRWSFTTKLGPPNAPTLVSPADGATIAGVNATLIWNKATNNPTGYRVEVSASPTVSAPFLFVDSTLTDTTRTFGPFIGCSTFYWHVRAYNDSGTSSYSAIRSFKTPQTVPDTVALISPADKAIDQPENTTLQWAPTGACPTTSYILETSLDSLFSTIALRETLTTTSTVYGPLSSNTVYYWRVYARNSSGIGLPRARSFRATAITTPQVPTLLSPANGVGGVSLTPILTWDSTARTKTWRVQVAYDAAFTLKIVDDSTLTHPSKQIGPLLDSTWYYWRVSAKNDAGTSAFSSPFSFYTMAPPTVPALVQPVNGQVDVPVVPTFYWTLPTGTAAFQLQVSKDSLFTNTVFDDSTITTTTKTISVWLKGYTQYFWRVRAKNPVGWSSYAHPWTFRTARVGAADWWFPLAVAETGPQRDTVYLGIHPLATFGIDPSLGELEMPQVPPPGNFDVRFVDIPSRANLLGQGLRLNFLPFSAYAQVDTFKVRFQPGVGTYPMIFSWPQRFVKDICDSMLIMDEFGGFTVHAWMNVDSTVTVTNSALTTLLIVEYGAFPLGVKKERGQTPRGFTLAQNYPNPFNPTTQIRFSTEHAAHIRLQVYDLLGRPVATLANGEFSAGMYSVTWDGKNENGITMPSGVYYMRMTATGSVSKGGQQETFTSTRKMIMMK